MTDPISTLIDIAATRSEDVLQRAIRESDRLDLIDPAGLRHSLDSATRRPGLGRLRTLLNAETFLPTDSELERRFLRLIRTAGLPLPNTQVWLNGYRVDFYWPELGLVVETDGLTYHRTPSQQTRDHLRDQAHAISGLSTLRFSAAQVRYEPERTMSTLATVIARIEAGR